MAHFAKIQDGIVVEVIVAEPEFFETFRDSSPGKWLQTSFNTRGGVHLNGKQPLRKNFAGVGYSYDPDRDAFIPPQPYSSWTLNDETCLWEPPTSRPDDGKLYTWDESILMWVHVPLDSP